MGKSREAASEQAADATGVSGQALVADREGHFREPPKPGSILIIDLPDLQFDLAQSLASTGPGAVLNASPSRTGRNPATGTEVLLDAGVKVIDNLGPEILQAEDGKQVNVTGSLVQFGEQRLSEGRLVTSADLSASGDRARLAARIESYALSSWNSFENESSLIMEGVGLPRLKSLLDGSVAVIIPPTTDLKALKKGLKVLDSYHPVIIGVGAGAAQAAQLGAKVDLVVGDPREIPPEVMTKARSVLIPGPPSPDTKKLLKQHSIAHTQVDTALSAADVALLTAYFGGATLIVDAGTPVTVEQYFDRDASEMVGAMLTRIQVEDRLVSLDALVSMYRPPVPTWALVLLFVAAIVAAGSAVLFTPFGSSFLELMTFGGSHG